MKTKNFKNYFLASIVLLLVVFHVFNGYAQEKKALSIGLTYYKVVDGLSTIKVAINFKGENGWEIAKLVPFEVVDISNAENEIILTKGNVDNHGVSEILLPIGFVKNENQIEVRVQNQPLFEDTSESISFKDVNLTAKLLVTQNEKNITAKLLDITGNPLAEEGLKFQVKRMFKGLGIGEGTYYTDENGEITVPIEQSYHSYDGNLLFEVVLEEHSDYGTVIAQMAADFGIASTDLSTFDKRKLWSPSNKTPLFYLIVPNIVLLIILGVFIFLIRNLVRISKS